MSVWVESTDDNGSAVWGCDSCSRGAWCWDHTTARLEARTHAKLHDTTVVTIGQRRGPRPDPKRDTTIARLRAEGQSIRTIAITVGLSTAGVIKALRRKEPA